MRVNATGSNNLTFSGDDLGSRSDNNFDIRLHIGIASFADAGNCGFRTMAIAIPN